MLKWLKETLLIKPESHAGDRFEPYEYPRLANYISSESGTVQRKIEEINNRREYMLVIGEEMLSMLERIRKETKSLNSEFFVRMKSNAKLELLDHLFSWVFPSDNKITKTTFIAGLYQLISCVFRPFSDPQRFTFFKIVYKPPEISEELLSHENGDHIPYLDCYIYMRLFSLLLDNLDILSFLTLSIRKTQLSRSNLQNLENAEFLKKVYLFEQKLRFFKHRLKEVDLPRYFEKNEFPTQGILSEKLQKSLEQKTISMETCGDLLEFIFDPVKGKKRVAKFVSFCNSLFKDISDQQSFQVLRILYLASKCDSVWLGELMKQVILNSFTSKVRVGRSKAKRIELLERAKFCEEVLKDWSDNFGSSILFELSFIVHMDYVDTRVILDEYEKNLHRQY